MRIKSFANSNPSRVPRSHDFYPGVTEVPLDSEEMRNDPSGMRGTYYSPQSNQWDNSTSTGLGSRRLTEEQVYQLLSKSRGMSREDFEELKKKVKGNKILEPIVAAFDADSYISTLVR